MKNVFNKRNRFQFLFYTSMNIYCTFMNYKGKRVSLQMKYYDEYNMQGYEFEHILKFKDIKCEEILLLF